MQRWTDPDAHAPADWMRAFMKCEFMEVARRTDDHVPSLLQPWKMAGDWAQPSPANWAQHALDDLLGTLLGDFEAANTLKPYRPFFSTDAATEWLAATLVRCVIILAITLSGHNGQAERLSVACCRELLGDSASTMSDDDILLLRDQLYALADICLEVLVHERGKGDR